ncbi:hypothetical protein AOXY_G19458 [Acipenser oxyrinchus oxyrinchus]|uniref:Glycoprotein hormone subunit beta domain-containing protein n=1 Tax=Acipenser oxyrinchus oxyrinchus TaxID=40147 RepID=A0AAD8G2N4_ACIOX|nr:hypothetical protein AOXY_G19458 [Acipenser oxyrinchus oxyrinchus]
MASILFCFVLLCWAAGQCHASCALENITIGIEKEGCGNCVSVNTTSCAGRCLTQADVYKSSISLYTQLVCTFKEISYVTVQLPNCPEHVDPFYNYPVALSCECGQCATDYTDCDTLSLGPSDCFSQED